MQTGTETLQAEQPMAVRPQVNGARNRPQIPKTLDTEIESSAES